MGRDHFSFHLYSFVKTYLIVQGITFLNYVSGWILSMLTSTVNAWRTQVWLGGSTSYRRSNQPIENSPFAFPPAVSQLQSIDAVFDPGCKGLTAESKVTRGFSNAGAVPHCPRVNCTLTSHTSLTTHPNKAGSFSWRNRFLPLGVNTQMNPQKLY